MLLGMFPMIYFEFLRILEKIAKREKKPENMGKHGPLHCSGGHPLRGVALRLSMDCLVAVRPKGQKGPPSTTIRRNFATPQCSLATPRRRHCSQGENFWILFSSISYSYTDSLRTLIND